MVRPISLIEAAPSSSITEPMAACHRGLVQPRRQEIVDDRDLLALLLGQFQPAALFVVVDAFLALLHHGLQHAHDLGLVDAVLHPLGAGGDIPVFQRSRNQPQGGGFPPFPCLHRFFKFGFDTVAQYGISHLSVSSPGPIN